MKEGSNCVKENTVQRNPAGFLGNFNNTLFKEIYYFYNICVKGKKDFFQPLIKQICRTGTRFHHLVRASLCTEMHYSFNKVASIKLHDCHVYLIIRLG